MAEANGITRSPAAAEMLVKDLSRYEEAQVVEALQRCRYELSRFPTLSDIIQRLPDGRPGVEEAWALCPKSESDSVVWTEEMSQAFGVARPLLLSGDEIAARMAFRESYSKILTEARARGSVTRWVPSLGSDVLGRSRALIEAVEKNRISFDRALTIDPRLHFPSHLDPLGITQKEVGLLECDSSGLTQFDPLAMVQKIKKQIEDNLQTESTEK